jgi:hypothetical protein
MTPTVDAGAGKREGAVRRQAGHDADHSDGQRGRSNVTVRDPVQSRDARFTGTDRAGTRRRDHAAQMLSR